MFSTLKLRENVASVSPTTIEKSFDIIELDYLRPKTTEGTK